MKFLYQPSHSALDKTINQINQVSNSKIHLLESTIVKQNRQLTDIRFQKNHIESQIQNLKAKHQNDYTKHIQRQEDLQQQIEESSKFITLQQLRLALETNNWNTNIGAFLNPLSLIRLNDILTQENQQILLKHSEQKLIILHRVVNTDQKITQLKNQISMLKEDIQGKQEQSGSLLMEYEELQEYLDEWQLQTGVDIEPLHKMFQIKSQLNQFRIQYFGLAAERESLEAQNSEHSHQINVISQKLNEFRKQEPLNSKSKIDIFWLSAEQVFQAIIKHDQVKQQQLYQLALCAHDKFIVCSLQLIGQSTTNLKERQKAFDQNYQELQQLLKDSSFTCESQDFQELLRIKMSPDQIIQSSSNFKLILDYRFNIQQNTLKHNQLKYFVQQYRSEQVDLERAIQKILYDQSMIQTNYQRLEQQYQQLRLNGPILMMTDQAKQLENLLDRMGQIEGLTKNNNTIVQLTIPQEIANITKQVIILQDSLSVQVKDLQNATHIEQNYFNTLIKSVKKLEGLVLPKLILDAHNQDCEYLEMEIIQNRKYYQQVENLYRSQLDILESKLQKVNEEEQNLMNKIDKVHDSLKDFTISSQDLNTTKVKENIPPSTYRRFSQQQDQSILGTIQIDMSRQTSTSQHTRSKSTLGNRTISTIAANNHFFSYASPTHSVRKTRLTLIQNRSNMSSQMSLKNPMLSPNYSQRESVSINASLSRTPERTTTIPVFKVYKRIISLNVKNQISSYLQKTLKYNGTSKCFEVFNGSNKECSWRQIQVISKIYDVRNVVKQNFTFSALQIAISKYQKVELLFGKKDDASLFIQLSQK